MSDDTAVVGEFVVVFPILGPEQPARLKRQAAIQLARMPEFQSVRLHQQMRWHVRKDQRGVPTHLIGRAAASTTEPADVATAQAEQFVDRLEVRLPALASTLRDQLAAAAP